MGLRWKKKPVVGALKLGPAPYRVKAQFALRAKITALHNQLAFEGKGVRVKSVVILQGALNTRKQCKHLARPGLGSALARLQLLSTYVGLNVHC